MQPLDWIKGSWVLAITLGLVVAFCATQRNTALLRDGKLAHAPQAAPVTVKEPDTVTKAKLQVTYTRLPLHFEPNQGQTDERECIIPGSLSRVNQWSIYGTLYLASEETVK